MIKQDEMCGSNRTPRENEKCCKNFFGKPSVKTIWEQHLVFQEKRNCGEMKVIKQARGEV